MAEQEHHIVVLVMPLLVWLLLFVNIVAENVKFTIYKPEKMKSTTYDRLMKKLVAILEKLEVGVNVKNVR